MPEILKNTVFWAAIAGIAAFIAGVAAVVAILQTHYANKTNEDLLALQEKYVNLQKASASFDVELNDGHLVLKGDGSSFAEPDRLHVVPIFSNNSGPPVIGQEIELAINSGQSLPSDLTITFSNIEDRVCAYPENAEICASPEMTLEVLKVTFEVNGRRDTDDVRYGS